MSRWSDVQSCKFVSLYKEAECLWNVFDPCYKNRDNRLATFKYIVQEMDIPSFTINDIAKKIRSLRSTYTQEKAKVTKSQKSGAGADDTYSPSVKWFNDMEFIMKNSNVSGKETTSNIDLMEQEAAINIPEHSEEPEMTDEIAHQVQVPPKTARPKKRARLQNISAAVKELAELNKNISSSPNVASTIFQEDEFDIIGKHVAIQLRKLPPDDVIDANLEIQQVLAKYRKKQIMSAENNVNTLYYVQSPESESGEVLLLTPAAGDDTNIDESL